VTRSEIKQWNNEHPYGARDEAYVDAVLEHVKKLWLTRPKERLGQALVNASDSLDLFFARDEEWVAK
jgi:hypothetical protein